MDYFPGFLDLRGRRCLVVGGGDVALRKGRLLRAAGADVHFVAPATSPSMREFIESQAVSHVEREFLPADLDGCWLVVTATGKRDVDTRVAAAAAGRRVFCNSVDDPANSSYITPAIVDRSPLVVAISSGGAAPVLARTVREKIEILLPVDFGRLAELARRWRKEVKNRIDGLAQRRRFWERLFDGEAPRLAMAGKIEQAERQVEELLVNVESGTGSAGKAWLVGAGPGDPDLLTMRALRIMQTADVILHDRLVSAEVLALARRDADLVAVGKQPGCRLNNQEAINDKLLELVRAGKHVCRLKGGDPFVFGRGGEELEMLEKAGVAVEVVPGITAATGCAAAAGIPLTHRDVSQSVVFITAHGKNSVDSLDWRSLARDRQTLVFYMAVARFGDLMNELIANGRSPDTPVAVIERGTLPDQRVVRGRLGQLQLLRGARRIEPPAILIVGGVAALGVRPDAAVAETVASGGAQHEPICAKQV